MISGWIFFYVLLYIYNESFTAIRYHEMCCLNNIQPGQDYHLNYYCLLHNIYIFICQLSPHTMHNKS